MNFTSEFFVVLLPITFLLWWTLPLERAKTFLFAMNVVFYSYFYPPYALILFFVGGVNYGCARRIAAGPAAHRKRYLALSIVSTVSLVFAFKYFNFFLGGVYAAQSLLTGAHGLWHPEILLPIGISFFTFQGMSYTIDVYRGALAPCGNFKDFFVYLSFFPQLVAGPIVRATDFLPQLAARARFTEDNLRVFLYRATRGFFLKIVIADNLAPVVQSLFDRDPATLTAPEAWLAAGLFAIQILCDFGGYSDIAIGTARLLGFNLLENFNNPYMATSLRNFWQRWHISLSTWFRDYLYLPLGGNRVRQARVLLNLMIVFVVSGLWHGANWTFVLWGALHGALFVAERLGLRRGPLQRAVSRPAGKFAYALFTLAFVIFAWVPFRAPSLAHTVAMWQSMFAGAPALTPVMARGSLFLLLFLIHFAKEALREWKLIGAGKNLLYCESLMYFALVLLMPGPKTDFVYFQF